MTTAVSATQQQQVSNAVAVDRLHKIRPVLTHFRNRMLQLYYPSRELSLDESMMGWRGRLGFRQYIQGKRHKYGIKIYVLAESTGLIYKLLVFSGKTEELANDMHTVAVVLHLMDGLLNAGHSLYMDNYYNSPLLAIRLLWNATYVTGTLRHRKGLPTGFTGKKNKVKRKERPLCLTTYHGNVMIGKWREKTRDVSFISTEHDCELVNIPRRRQWNPNVQPDEGPVSAARLRKRKAAAEDVYRPQAIAEYNEYMSGIDLADQMLSYYSPLRKTLAWYKKLFFHIMCIMMYNSFKLHRIAYPDKVIYYEEFIK